MSSMRSDRVEAQLLHRLQDVAFDRPGMLPAARGLSYFGEHSLGWLGLAAAGAAADSRRRRQWGLLGASAFTAHAASVILKRIVRRRRPHAQGVRVGVGTPSELSFPSSHVTSTAAALSYLSRITGRKAPLAGIPVMMLSRMVLGVHYPSDTVAGAGLGLLTTAVVSTLEEA